MGLTSDVNWTRTTQKSGYNNERVDWVVYGIHPIAGQVVEAVFTGPLAEASSRVYFEAEMQIKRHAQNKQLQRLSNAEPLL